MNVIDFFAKIQGLFLELPHKFPIPVERHMIACKLHLQKNLKLLTGRRLFSETTYQKDYKTAYLERKFSEDLLKEKYFLVAYKEIYTK